jgi:uncharacterized protein YdhG (YjbR/CyaY superfamily)
MPSQSTTVDAYINEISEDRKDAIEKLRKIIKKNLPKGFNEELCYGMIGYCVPHSKYPKGYHCKPEQALPFINIASQKNFIALYHMGLYADPKLYKWFTDEYAAKIKGKLDMGKSCIRFKKPEQIPFDLIGELATKMTPDDWIACYEKSFVKK